jgi:hypothetical protein
VPVLSDRLDGDRNLGPGRGEDEVEGVEIAGDRSGETQDVSLTSRGVDLDEVRDVHDLDDSAGRRPDQ